MFNQGFFTHRYIAADGTVDHAELQEPFVQLMARNDEVVVRRVNRTTAAPEDTFLDEATGTDGSLTIPALLSRGQTAHRVRARQADEAVLVSFDKRHPAQLSLGSNKQLLAVSISSPTICMSSPTKRSPDSFPRCSIAPLPTWRPSPGPTLRRFGIRSSGQVGPTIQLCFSPHTDSELSFDNIDTAADPNSWKLASIIRIAGVPTKGSDFP
jgi:hypothetical protein